MFHLPLPLLEKSCGLCWSIVSRRFPAAVWQTGVGAVESVRSRGPVELSNTVQNAMIGDDNSVSGGVIGAFSLLAINWLLTRVLFRAPKLNQFFELPPTVLIRHGVVDWEATKKEALTELELRSVLHKQALTGTRSGKVRSRTEWQLLHGGH